MKRPILSLIVIVVGLCVFKPVQAQDSLWAGNFGPTGIFGSVRTIGSWGDSLVIGGQISGLPHSTFTAHNFVIFDLVDRSWQRTQLGPEGSGDEVRALAEGPDGSLFIGGDFTFNVADTIFDNIARLDKDGNWKTLSGGLTDGIDGPVNALFWHQGKLYIGGEFQLLGFTDPVAFTIWDPDTGFDTPPGLEFGFDSFNPIVNDFAYSDAHGNHLYIGGNFAYEDSIGSECIVRYDIDASEFEAMPIFPFGGVNVIYTENNEDWKDRIAVGGDFGQIVNPYDTVAVVDCSNIAIINFTDTTFELPGQGTNGPVFALEPVYSSEDQLLIGGEFDSVNGVNTGPLARWSPSIDYWSQFNPNFYDSTDAVYAISGWNEGRYTIGGNFDYIDDSAMVNHVIQISSNNSARWYPLGDGLIFEGPYLAGVNDVASDGRGNFYAVGRFNHAGGRLADNVAKWDGDRWWSLGDGVDSPLAHVVARDDTVYVAGNSLTSASGVPVNGVAMWDGSQWHDLGGGIPNGTFSEMVLDSAGNLYVCGRGIDSAGATAVSGVAKWNGTGWEAVGDLRGQNSVVGDVRDMFVDQTSQDVYVCGTFETADGNFSNGVARWDGDQWYPLGGADIGDGIPYAMERAPNGNIVVAGFIDRPEMRQMISPGFWEAYAGGVATNRVNNMLTVGCDFFLTGEPLQFVGDEANPVPVDNIARWDGSEWIDLAGGKNVGGDVKGVAAHGSKLAIGGNFGIAADKRANAFTIWTGLRSSNANIGLFVKPNYDDTLIANEIYEILWDASSTTADEIDLEISYDSGKTWQTLAGNVEAQLGIIPWLVPDVAVSDCRMRISDTYAPCASRLSWPFHIVPGPIDEVSWLRRFDGPFYQEPFVPGYHTWAFGNTGANCWPDSVARDYPYPAWFRDEDLPDSVENFPPWSLFAAAFGDDWCYRNAEPGRVRPRAMERWKNLLTKWGGSCLGFSTSALLWWEHVEFNTNLFIPDDYLVKFDLGTFSRNMVNKHWIYQQGGKHAAYNREVRDNTPMQTVAAIREGITSGDPRTLSFSWKSWKDKTDSTGTVVDSILRTVGHNVIPYAIKTFADSSGIYHLSIYDSNRSSSKSRYIRVDSINGTWSYPAGNIADSTGRFVPRLPISEYAGLATDDRKTTLLKDYPESGLLLFTSATEEILITDSLGNQIGWLNNEAVNTVTDASPMTTDDTDYQYDYPRGYFLPDGDYRVELTKFQKASTRISLESNSTVYTYERSNTDSTQMDVLYLGAGIDIVNQDNTVKNITIKGIHAAGDEERFVRLEGLAYAQGDSSSIEIDSSGTIAIENFGQDKNYTFILWYSDLTDDSYTQSLTTIPLSANSTHQFDPPWTGLEDSSIYVRIDNDQDGTADDSLLVDIATDVEDEQGRGALPGTYELGQNYPNPFNPSTTIDYSVPVRCHVNISVFNLLGQKVVSLVDEQKSAGSYSVTWNGRDDNNQQAATGVYFYRLQVEDRLLTKKMLLLK